MRRVVLPDAVRLRPRQQDHEDGGGGGERRDPDRANHWRVSTSPAWCLQATRCTLAAVNVLLPDGSKLELPDGATGLDAARAIGPKLAEQAVLVRANGRVQDLRL
ncbi:MAG: TGS domain-containing protein, partial [Gaiellaceae bacterium]